jgi:hypothetical protein
MNNLSSVCHTEFIMSLIIFVMGRSDSDRTVDYRHLAIAFLILILVLSAPLTRAQDNYEIQVYGPDLVDPGHTMVELHSNFTIDGSKTIVDGVYPFTFIGETTSFQKDQRSDVSRGFSGVGRGSLGVDHYCFGNPLSATFSVDLEFWGSKRPKL